MEYIDILDSNGNFTGIKKERNLVHSEGDWHKVVQIFVVNKYGILLQQRSLSKKSEPGKWCASASGHISFGYDSISSAIKEFKEELGLKLSKKDLLFVKTFKSPSETFNKGNKIINNHFVDLYIVTKDIDINDITIQKDEVEKVKYFSINDFIKMINNNLEELINAPILFDELLKYLIKN